MNESKALIIWGMHRSGTSLLASWLRACGLNIGSELLGEGVGNERGHFEDMDFLNLHEKILKANGIECGGLLKTEPLQISSELSEEMCELVARKCQSQQWGWKEPRTCLFTHEYHQLLPQARHLVVYRHYALVVDSLVRRRMKSRFHHKKRMWWLKRAKYEMKYKFWQRFQSSTMANQYLATWVKYNENLLALIGQVGTDNVVVMDCRDLVAASLPTLDRLQSWGFVLQAQSAESYIEPSMIASTPSYDYGYDPALKARAEAIMQDLATLASQEPTRSMGHNAEKNRSL